MRFRAGAFVLHLLLVLTLLLEVAGHDLLCEREDEALPRAVDQVAEAERRAPSPEPELVHGDAHYERECPCCLRGGKRISLDSKPKSSRPLWIAQASRVPDGGPPIRQLPASCASRGPPAS